jgi:hypothetical protein
MSTSARVTVLHGRVALEKQRIADARRLVSAGPGADELRRIAGDRLGTMLRDVETRLDRLAGRVAAGDAGPDRMSTLTELQTATDRVCAEVLTLALGALARAAGVDHGMCGQADTLIRELADRVDRRFARPTVPGSQEQLHRAADVVRQRAPGHGLWDLPVMAHEFGHVVATGLQAYDAVNDQVWRPVESWLSEYDGARRQQVTELFCDVFATYALGPSYPCTLLLHRLDPAGRAVAAAGDTHPGDPSRAYACLWTLRRMHGDGSPPYARQLRQLTTAWAELQRDVPSWARLTDDQRATVHGDLAGCWGPLDEALGSLRFEWSPRIRDLVAHLTDPRTAAPPDGHSTADLLNAAWIVRLEAWSSGAEAPADLEKCAQALLTRSGGSDGGQPRP